MRTSAVETRSFEFYFPTLDTLAQVEDLGKEVVIRTSRKTFSADRKTCFVRELAAEGFIPDSYQWLPSAGLETARRVRWLVDISSFQPDQARAAQARRFMIRLLSSAALLWLTMIGVLWLHSVR